MSSLWPRLPVTAARTLLDEYTKTGTTPTGTLDHPARIYAATGGIRVASAEVGAIRSIIVETAKANGFNNDSNDQHIRFDRQLAPQLVDSMGMVPAEASNKAVWTYMAVVVAPDVTSWRFGFGNDERWIASDLTRQMFSRLWWQAYLLTNRIGDRRDTGLLDALSESDLNQLLERTRLGGQRPVVQAIAAAVIAAPAHLPRRDVIRETTLRALRRMAFTEFMSLSEEQLNAAVSELVDEVAGALADSAYIPS